MDEEQLNQTISDVRDAFDRLAEVYVLHVAQGRSDRSFWRWARAMVNERVDLLLLQPPANDR